MQSPRQSGWLLTLHWCFVQKSVLHILPQSPVIKSSLQDFLEPLDELKIVLELALHQPLHCDDLGGHGGAVGQCSQHAPNTAGTPAQWGHWHRTARTPAE